MRLGKACRSLTSGVFPESQHGVPLIFADTVEGRYRRSMVCFLLLFLYIGLHYRCIWSTKKSILGFHMTSQKFKLRNYRFFCVSTFMSYKSTLKPLYKQIFGSNGVFLLRYRTLDFPDFCVTRHLAGGRESSYVGYNVTDFWTFCYLNIPCLRKKYYFDLYEFLAKNSRISRKTQKQMFLLVSGGHSCAPERGTNMASPFKAL